MGVPTWKCDIHGREGCSDVEEQEASIGVLGVVSTHGGGVENPMWRRD